MLGIGYHLRRALQGLGAKPMSLLLTLGSVALAFLLVGSVLLMAQNLSRLTDGWGSGATVAVDLTDGAPPADVARIEQGLRELGGVSQVRRVSPEEAKANLVRSLGEDGRVLADLEPGFLPLTIEVTLGGDRGLVLAAQKRIARMAGAVPGVEAVQTVESWFHRLDRLITGIRVLAGGLGLLVLVVCVYIIMVTIRLRFVDRRHELQVLRLMGATERFVKTPYLLEGIGQGALGAGLAAGLLFALYSLVSGRVESIFGTAVKSSQLGFLPGSQLVYGLLVGACCGFLGAVLATRKPGHG